MVESYEIASPMGYGQSKNVTERILGVASQYSHVPVSVFRLGQVAGSTRLQDSAWPEHEWFPSLLKTSLSLGLLPGDLPAVDWIPIDHVAQIILELAYSDYKSEQHETVYNLVNPRSTPWDSLYEGIREHLRPEMKIVPFTTWLTALEKMQTSQNVSSMPALKLLGHFQGLQLDREVLKFKTKRAIETSTCMAQLESVNLKWMKVWLEQWNF